MKRPLARDALVPAADIAQLARRLTHARPTRAVTADHGVGGHQTDSTGAIHGERQDPPTRRGLVPLNPRNRRHHPATLRLAHAARIAACDDAARAGPDARTDRDRSWIAIPRGR
jgi:hypothetical protein